LLINHSRGIAYAALTDAVQRDDDAAAARASQQFLNAQFVKIPNGREIEVQNLLVDASERPKQRVRDEATASLTEALGRDDLVGIMEASQRFLEALSPVRGDPREQSVRDAYARAFS